MMRENEGLIPTRKCARIVGCVTEKKELSVIKKQHQKNEAGEQNPQSRLRKEINI